MVLGLLFINIFFCAMAMVSISPLFSEVMKEIPLTGPQMGMVMGVVPLASLLFAPLGGGLSDKVGCRLVFGGAAVLAVVAGGLRYYVASPMQLMLCMLFIGAGLAIFTTVMPKALSSWFPPQNLTQANGIGMSSMGFGQAVAMATAVGVMAPAFGGWRGAMVAFAVGSLICGILLMLFYKEGQVSAGGSQAGQASGGFKDVLKIKDIWMLAFFYGLFMIDLMGLTAFLPSILEKKGISNAGGLVAIWMITSVIFNIVGAIVSDIVGKRKPFLIGCGIVFAICIPCFITLTGVPLIIALFLAGAAVGTAVPIVMTVPVEIKQIGPALAGTAMGVVFMIGNTGGFVGPVITGMLLGMSTSVMPAFIFMAVAALVAAFIVMPMQETGRKK